ncbi:hypothetical protein BpHYR1_020585, partial [Brachionus plicatilis]
NGYSCYADFGDGKRCLCETVTQWWTGSTCVDKYWYSNNCGSTCQCREDKGLGCQSFGYYNRYSCTSSYIGTRCYCKSSTQYWSGTTNGCINKYWYADNCGSTCQCREDKGLGCQSYGDYNRYSCTSSYTGTKCYCKSSTDFWLDSTSGCINKYWHSNSCGSTCQCREDKGLGCQSYGDYNRYSCTSSYTGTRCYCKSSIEFWSGTTNGCITKYLNLVSCSSSCQCREDLGLACRSYAGFYSCNTYFADTRCTCVNTAFWTGSTCVTRYGHLATCTDSCQCQMNLGLRCETLNNNCYSYTGSRCVCQSDQYWDGSLCRNKKNNGDSCSNDCECRSNDCFNYGFGKDCTGIFG